MGNMQYAEMKDSGVPWVGKIPSAWKCCKIKTILRNISIKNHPDAQVLSLYREYGVVPKDSRDDNHNVTSEDTASYKYVEPGDLVINKMKAWQGSLGLSQYTGIVSPAYYVCRFISTDMDKNFFHHLIRTKNYAQEFERLSTGMRIGQWDLGIDDFLSVPIVFPSIREQTAIASYLDDKCSAIDDVIAQAKETIEEYKSWKASVIFEAVTKGLDPKVEMKDSGVEWIGMIPKAWDITSIKQHYSITLGKMLESEQTTEDSTYENYMCASNLKWGGIDTNVHRQMWFSPSEKQKYLLQEGDLLIMEGGSAGTSSIYHNEFSPCYIQNSVNRCRGKADNLATFLYYWMFFVYHCGHVESVCNRATIMHLTKEKLGRLAFVDVSPAEQACIVTYLDSRCAAIDGIISEKHALISELESYKKSLIFETVTGKRRVC